MTEESKAVRQQLAHALLSPLTVILGSLDMLLNQETAWPGYAREVLGLAMAQAQRLHDTLNELLMTAEVHGRTVSLSWPPPAAPRAESGAAEERGTSAES